MEDQKLRNYLFDDSMRLYAVLDGIMVPDLPIKLHEGRVPNYCLLKGLLTPDAMHAAPYLVQLSRDSKFTDQLLSEAIGKFWGVFLKSRSNLLQIRVQLRNQIKVYDEEGNRRTFRFYDPRVLRDHLPKLSGEELTSFFGKVDTFFAEAPDKTSLLSFKSENGALKQTELK